jgi:hypothetical protein
MSANNFVEWGRNFALSAAGVSMVCGEQHVHIHEDGPQWPDNVFSAQAVTLTTSSVSLSPPAGRIRLSSGSTDSTASMRFSLPRSWRTAALVEPNSRHGVTLAVEAHRISGCLSYSLRQFVP